jgi:regulator of sigma E protease
MMPWYLELAVFEIVFLSGVLGQAAMARLAGMRVEVISFGYGPRLARAGRVQLAALPIGGYVRVAGLHPTESTVDNGDRRAFFNRPWPLRALVVLGWPIGALLVVMAGTAASSMVYGRDSIQTAVSDVAPGSPAEAAGLEPGDEILTADGASISRPGGLARQVSASGGRPVLLDVKRGEQRLALPVTAREEQGEYRIGVRLTARTRRTRATFPGALVDSVGATGSRVADVLRGFVVLVVGSDEMEFGGPVGLTEMVARESGPAEAAEAAVLYGVYLVAWSLVPIPPLPAGQLLLLILGWRSRRLRSTEPARDLVARPAPRRRMPPALLAIACLPLVAMAATGVYLSLYWNASSAIIQLTAPHLLLAGALALRLPRAWAWGVYLPLFELPQAVVALESVGPWIVSVSFLLLATPATLLLPAVRRAFGRQCPQCNCLAAAPVRSSPRISCLACGSGYSTK